MKPRILFVDDEPRVLLSIRDLLHRQRNRWDLVFADGSETALVALEAGPFDVVVSDMRMPGMNGADLLTRVRDLQPQASRIILSGQTDQDTALRAAQIAHQFFSKPCDSQSLVSMIERALLLGSQQVDDCVRSIVAGMDRLPSPPLLYQAVQRSVRSEDSSIGDVAKLIARDPAMTVKILQLVNSAFFGLPRHVTAIDSACVYLGLSTISDLVLASEIFGQVSPENAALADRVQQEALVSAAIARGVVTDKKLLDDVLCASLLHDIGMLLLATRLPAEYAALEVELAESTLSRSALERLRLGVTHADVGAFLINLWGLPGAMATAIAEHHGDWKSDEPTPLSLYTYLARWLGDANSGSARAVEPLDTARLEASGIAIQTDRWNLLARKALGREEGTN
jgi:HD-like signal output (HDOD) protein